MLGRLLLLFIGLVVAGALPSPIPAAWLAFLADFMGRDWAIFADRYNVAAGVDRLRPWVGWGLVVIALLGLRQALLWPLRHAYWFRRIFGRRIFGRARWAKVRDLRRPAGKIEDDMTVPGGLFLGRVGRTDIYHNGEGHLLTIGGVGGGKSSGLVVPALLTLTQGSVIVTDPSGELVAMTARHRATVGPVIFLSPYADIFESETGLKFEDMGFNPMSVIDPDASTFMSDVGALSRHLMVSDRRESGSYWNDEGTEFLTLMIAAIILYEPKDLHNFSFLYQLVRDNPDALAARLKGIIRDGHPALQHEAERFLGIIVNAQPQWQGISSKAALATKRYAPSTPLGRHVIKEGFDARRLKTEKVTVFILVPSKMLATSLPWLNMLVGVFGAAIGQPGPRSPVTMLIDEAPALGFLPDLRAHMAQFRKVGLRVWLFTQTYSALAGEELYGAMGMKEIEGLATIKQYFAVEEPDVQRKVSELAGQRSVSNPSSTGATGDVGRPLITPDEVRGLRRWHQIIIRGGMSYPIRAKLIPYFTRKNWRGMVDKNPYRG